MWCGVLRQKCFSQPYVMVDVNLSTMSSVVADVVVGNQNAAAAALHCWGRRLVSSVSPAAKIITGSELRLSLSLLWDRL